jgi:ribose transport system substrate-binding protein
MTHNSLQKRSKRRPARGRQVTALIGALVLALALAAGGSSALGSSRSVTTGKAASSSSTGVAAATAELKQYSPMPTKISITTPLKSAPPAGKTMVMLVTTNPSNVLIGKTLQKLAAMAHWKFSLASYDPANPGTFTSALTTALAKHPQYLVEDGLPLTAADLQAAKKAGAKWIVDSVSPLTVVPPILAAIAGHSQDALMGKLVADYFISNSGGKGNAEVEHVPAYPILNAFLSGFTNEVKAACPHCNVAVTNISIPDLEAGKVPSTMVSALQQNPSANYLVFDDGPFADGVTSALAAAGLSGKVKIIGQAADQAGMAAVKAGTETMWTRFDPSYQALLDMDVAFRASLGMKIPVKQEATQPTQVLTKATIGSSTNWAAPTNSQAQFLKLWHLR